MHDDRPIRRPNPLPRQKVREVHWSAHADDSPGMGADLQALNEDVAFPPELRVERVGDEGTLSEFVEVARAGFELPEFTAWYIFEACRAVGLAEGSPVRNYVGRIDGEAVATASVALAAGVAGVCNVATLPQARRRERRWASASTDGWASSDTVPTRRAWQPKERERGGSARECMATAPGRSAFEAFRCFHRRSRRTWPWG
jgi:hypothetical protein